MAGGMNLSDLNWLKIICHLILFTAAWIFCFPSASMMNGMVISTLYNGILYHPEALVDFIEAEQIMVEFSFFDSNDIWKFGSSCIF